MERTNGASEGDFVPSTSGLVPNFAEPVSALQWEAGVQLPSLTESNTAFVELCKSILNGTALIIPAINVSEAVVVLVYRLIMKSSVFTSNRSMASVYVVLASLFHRRIVERDDQRQRLLNLRIVRPARMGSLGLDAWLRYHVGQRGKDAALRGMTYEEAEAVLLRKLDSVPFDFDFGSADCGGPGSGTDEARGSISPDSGPGGGDGLGAGNNGEKSSRQPQAVAESYKLQLIRARERIDKLQSEKAALEATTRAAELVALREVRLREDAVSKCAAKLDAARDAAQLAERVHGKEIRERLRVAHASYLHRKKELELERRLAEDKVTEVQVENSQLERQLKRAEAALRTSGREAASALADVEAELERVREGRVWTRVREEQERRGRAEEESGHLQAEVDQLMSELNSRSMQHAAEKQELKYLRHRVKSLQETVAAYQVKSNRKFFEVEPIAEENARLRSKIEEQVCVPNRCPHGLISRAGRTKGGLRSLKMIMVSAWLSPIVASLYIPHPSLTP